MVKKGLISELVIVLVVFLWFLMGSTTGVNISVSDYDPPDGEVVDGVIFTTPCIVDYDPPDGEVVDGVSEFRFEL
ncbi:MULTISPECIES: hypothetical protein [Kosmotoga]|uniref:Uncharacterized protein n=1 Tax=Kosmotoga olearia (strain ATCC BAA-1733 / DSM 21960 / TBF 19.5.1) TaxID=521045 RepID=C5CFP1_KOSOT|nr:MULTISPECIES: hypothetical protein [Kosmotoga]ACR80389.1 hypothetical protein Kole_1701 [Kosmotoga olearia TBF 19.5.1]MDI3523359.1 hypothetical protein [Kosmotoga sp.]MDK2952857.1 hypothetical protein [Kosmotoga sp.]OAA19892.1 hypothetical protein DU53_09325 [Kosmotoga sp. DU53]